MKDPAKIFRVSKKRDEMLFNYHALSVGLDTYNDNDNIIKNVPGANNLK